MAKGFSPACALLYLVFAGCQVSAPPFKFPPETANLRSPMESTPSSISGGDRVYHGSNCAVCHGHDGNGRGYMSGASNFNCRNWKEPSSLANYTDGELYYIIGKGKGRMPGYEGHFHPQEVWMMVEYIRALAKKPAA